MDVERHFEGVPRTQIRDLVAVQRPKANEKTISNLREAAELLPYASHSVNEGKQLE